jgi:3-hydroxyacyl-[acyl-carrier-protein] dehydratase
MVRRSGLLSPINQVIGIADQAMPEYIFPLEFVSVCREGGDSPEERRKSRMRFQLLDRILAFEPEKSLRGLKRLTGGEEYLADHFPGFPIMPGVLQLQALVEAASWLLRLTDHYRHSVIVLREVKSVRFGNLMVPGKALEVSAELVRRDDSGATFKAKGEADGLPTVNAQFTLASYNLADRNPAWAERDERLRKHWMSLHEWLTVGTAMKAG